MVDQPIQNFMSNDGRAQFEVALDQESVWLSQAQMAGLFGTKRPAITKHPSSVYKSGGLDVESICYILEHMYKVPEDPADRALHFAGRWRR